MKSKLSKAGISEKKFKKGFTKVLEYCRARKSQKKRGVGRVKKERKKNSSVKFECYLILKVQENKFHIKMNNRKVLGLIQYTV